MSEMGDNVTPLPVLYRRPREIRGKEIWQSPEPSDLMVWSVCPYAKGSRGVSEGCQQCPAWFDDPDHGQCKQGCRAWAEEACRVMMAVQRRELPTGVHKDD